MSEYLPRIEAPLIEKCFEAGDADIIFDLFVSPLHEELYRVGDFKFLEKLSPGQRLLISYDYLRMQVGQGGFIQFLVNGYVWLLPEMPELLGMVGAPEMAKLIDDVLRVFVLNISLFDKEHTNEEFARLYQELTEFEQLDQEFNKLNKETMAKITTYIKEHLNDFTQG